MNRLPYALIEYIIEFCVEPVYQFRKWVNMKKIDWNSISKQPHAIDCNIVIQLVSWKVLE